MQKHVNLVDLVKSFPTLFQRVFTVYYFVAKSGVDTAENEPSKVCRYQHPPPWIISSALETESEGGKGDNDVDDHVTTDLLLLKEPEEFSGFCPNDQEPDPAHEPA